MLFSIGPNYHAALLSAVDDYYDLVKTVSDGNVRETAISFLPNVENYTIIFRQHDCCYHGGQCDYC